MQQNEGLISGLMGRMSYLQKQMIVALIVLCGYGVLSWSLYRETDLMLSRNTTFIVAGSCLIVAFALWWRFYRISIERLKLLKIYARRIEEGDFSERIDIESQDEFGEAFLVFNQMAFRLQLMVDQSRHLFEATDRLSRGDYTARLSVEEGADPKVRAVALAFNAMAESFGNIVKRIHYLVNELSTSAKEIAQNSKHQEMTVAEQGIATQQLSEKATEISATSKEFVDLIGCVSRVASGTSQLAEEGQMSLSAIAALMRHMEASSNTITSNLKSLNEKAGNVHGVVTTITKVSEETNLLSLNAAIEAEKAGEYGRSFSVIAREIRRLADLTSVATQDIEKTVSEILSAVSTSVIGANDFTREIREGVDQIRQVGIQLARIIDEVQTLVSRFKVIDQGIKTQSTAAEEINKALQELSKMALETSTSMAKFGLTVHHLDKAALNLNQALGKAK